MHLVITDSGLGGLSVCAEVEKLLRESPRPHHVQITFVNAWPDAGQGYNDLADVAARARVFDNVLRRISAMRPDFVLIACNTLSIVYQSTAFQRAPSVPVQGIVETGVDMFDEALASAPGSSMVLLGTRTTIASGVHRARLLERGVAPERIASATCHGLATAIEHGPDNELTARLIDTCAADAVAVAPAGDPLYIGLCCTHYGMIAGRIAGAIARRAGRPAVPLDPNARLANEVVTRIDTRERDSLERRISVTVISKVELSGDQRQGVGELLERISPATADALRGYTRVPDLF